jgi:hypothetical protein
MAEYQNIIHQFSQLVGIVNEIILQNMKQPPGRLVGIFPSFFLVLLHPFIYYMDICLILQWHYRRRKANQSLSEEELSL